MVEATPTASPASERARANLVVELRALARDLEAEGWDEDHGAAGLVAEAARILADQASVEEAAQHALTVLVEQTPAAYLGGPVAKDKLTARQQAIAKLRAALSPAPSAQGAPLTPTEQHDER